MTDQIREQVSALLDGELPHDEIGLLVRRMERNPELRGSFGRYTLIGEALRAPGGEIAGPSFAARVGAAIDAPGSAADVDTPAAARSKVFWKRPAFATAMAAGFALLAVVLVRPYMGQESDVVAANTEAAPKVAPLSGGVSPTPAQSQRLAGYLVAHSQFSSAIARRSAWSGLLAADPSLQRVSFESQDVP